MSVAVFTSYDTQFDNSGNVLSGGSITVYEAGTTNLITLKSASDLSGSSAANPIILDTAGRHDMRYFALQAYKVLRKNSAGATVLPTLDNIDPGVAVGTGVLAITNGGTGAASGPAALTAIGGATAASVADIAVQVAAVTGALGSTAKTHLATGTTGQRDAVPAEGDARRNTSTGAYEGYNSSGWINFITSDFTSWNAEDNSPDTTNDFLLTYDASASTTKKVKPITLAFVLNATQAQMEAGTETNALVSPATQKYHPSACKAWAKWGVTSTIDASSGLTSITDNGTADWTLNLSVTYSSANYAVVYGEEPSGAAGTNAGGSYTRPGGQATTTLRVAGWEANAGSFSQTADGVKHYAATFGDL